jgi:hypothetical protein
MEPNRFAFLRQVLFVDASVSGVFAAVMLAFASPLASLLELPAGLIFAMALSFVPFVALVLAVARPAEPRAAGVWLVIALNLGGAVATAALALSGQVTPNALGWAYLAAQGLFVVAIAELEYLGLRRAQGLGGNSRRSSASVGAPT